MRRPPHTSPYLAVRFFLYLARLPGGVARLSALYFLLPAIGTAGQSCKKRKADILRMSAFPLPAGQRRDFPERSYERFWGRGGELNFSRRERPKAARRAVPIATEEATGIDSNAKGFPSPRTSLSPLPTVPPAPRQGRGHPDGWPRNWRVRNRRRTGRCAAA